MRRREFVGLIGCAVTLPRTGLAQQSAQPVIGFLRNTSPGDAAHLVAAFRKGLGEAGYTEGRNVAIEYRWSDGRTDRLAAMALELVERRVRAIVTLGSTPAVRAAKAATTTIPIVFMIGADPVELGIIESLSRPGGNLTGVFNLNQQLAQKWLEILYQLAPSANAFALLVNPANSATTERYKRDVHAAAGALGLRMDVVEASSEREFERSFAALRELRAAGLVIAADLLFISHMEVLAKLALRSGLPAIYPFREFVFAGGLVSYGPTLPRPIGSREFTPAESLMARSRPICRRCRPPRSNCSSISRPQRRLALRSRLDCSGAPMRWSSDGLRGSGKTRAWLLRACGWRQNGDIYGERWRRAVSSVGRASRLHREGRRFEPVTAHQSTLRQQRKNARRRDWEFPIPAPGVNRRRAPRRKPSDRLFEFLGGAERDLLARLDLNRLAGRGIAAHARGAFADLQDAEPGHADAVAFLEVLGQPLDEIVQHGFRLLLGHFVVVGKFGGEMLEGHGCSRFRGCFGHGWKVPSW